jgi:2-polyprenyl-6-methoxyphenol hydroxylase-like FAD-dependent oxidoreductase
MAYYLTVLQSRPQVWDLLSPGVMSERLRGMSDLPNFLRTSAGRGWVLAGDAGHHKDPVIARGIADAFRDAELIAAATQRGWDGDLDAALADYPRERDACARPLSDANISLARLDRSGQELGESFFAMSALEAELDAPVSAASPVTS